MKSQLLKNAFKSSLSCVLHVMLY